MTTSPLSSLNSEKQSEKQRSTFEVAYQQALYEVFNRDQTITLRVNVHSDELKRLLQDHQQTTWALITAYNPHSQVFSEAENQALHLCLVKEVKQLGLSYLNAVGREDSGEWQPEKSLFIMGITQAVAMALGTKFSQNAILYGAQGSPPQLIWLVE